MIPKIGGRPVYYELDENHQAHPATRRGGIDVFEGDFEKTRRVAQTLVGEANVSTVFLGIDHVLFGGGPPILFETMVFGGQYDDRQWRYSTWDEAVAGHEAVVAALREGKELQ